MPLKLSVGVSRKVGQPGFGSLGASCGVEVEADPGLLREDPEEFERRARSAFAACARAVDAELARLAAPPAPAITHGDDHTIGRVPGPSSRPATPRQLRALGSMARARGVDTDDLLAASGLDSGTITAAEASRLISGLRAAAAG
jgi:hypothetical protein